MRKPNSNPFKPIKLHGKDFIVKDEGRGWVTRRIDHPLLKGMFEGKWAIEEARQDLAWRKDKFRLHVCRKEWEQCIDMLQPRLRLGYLLSLRRHIDDDGEFFRLLRHVLSQNPNLHAYDYFLRQLYRRMGNLAPWDQMMTEAEIERLRQLPAQLVLWHGSGNPGLGWSWTPDQKLALGYASSYLEHAPRGQAYVFKGQIPKTSIIGVFLDTPHGHETVFANPDQILVLDGARVGVSA